MLETLPPSYLSRKHPRGKYEIIYVHDGAALWLPPSYLRDRARAILQSRNYRPDSTAPGILTTNG